MGYYPKHLKRRRHRQRLKLVALAVRECALTLLLVGWSIEPARVQGRYLVHSPIGEYMGFADSWNAAVWKAWAMWERPDQAMWTGRQF